MRLNQAGWTGATERGRLDWGRLDWGRLGGAAPKGQCETPRLAD